MSFVIESDRDLKPFSTFKIGGNARYFAQITTFDEAKAALSFAIDKKLQLLVIGKGSNLLIDDKGFNGLVVHNRISFCEFAIDDLYVGSGYSFALLGVQTAKRGWSGLEFASGIPGTVGGAVAMNAGAGAQETKDVLKEVSFLNEQLEIENTPISSLEFGYRNSPFQKRMGIILAARFELTQLEEAKKHQKDLIDYRLKTQPYKDRSAGCVFQNPPGQSAGQLIEQCGLKDMRVGGAKVSSLHANFIVNEKEATASNVKKLIEEIESRVKEKTGIELVRELQIIDYENQK